MKSRLSMGAAVSCAAALVCAVGATAASAHRFEWNKSGVALHSRALNTQKWTVPRAAVECAELEFTKGEIDSNANEYHFAVTVLYKGCKFGGTIKLENFSANYMLEAEDSFSVLQPITMKSTEAGDCTITIPSEGNQKLPLTYKNIQNSEHDTALEVIADATGLTSSGTGLAASCNYSNYAGRFEGRSEVFAVGTNLNWS